MQYLLAVCFYCSCHLPCIKVCMTIIVHLRSMQGSKSGGGGGGGTILCRRCEDSRGPGGMLLKENFEIWNLEMPSLGFSW